jgi:hypothetical protein
MREKKKIPKEPKSKYPPSRINGLKPFPKGQSGNPGGVAKGTTFISEAYKRLLAMTPAELVTYQPKSGAEQLALEHIRQGISDPDKRTQAIREIADRTEGRPKQPIEGSGSFGITMPQLKSLLMTEGNDDAE